MSDQQEVPDGGNIDAASEAGQRPSGRRNFTPIFLLSAPRSGSAWLRDVLGAHPDIASGPETYAFEALGWFLAVVEERARSEKGLLGAGYVDRVELGRACAQLYRSAIASRVGGRAYFVEKTPLNTDFLDVIDLAFPAAKVVHLVRDGRDVACSMITARRERGMSLPADVRGATARWRRIERVIAFGERHPERYCEVRYEALVAALRPQLERLFAFLEIPLVDSVLDRMCEVGRNVKHPSAVTGAAGFLGKWRASFSPEDVRVFKEGAGRLLIHLGYERDDRW
jgi:hypothetical protein